MNILIIHLSDIHLKAAKNSIFHKIDPLCKSIQNHALQNDYLFLLVTGDISYSGSDIEYTQAKVLLDTLIKHLKNYSNKTIQVILIPGNHDCNFDIHNKSKRNDRIQQILAENNPSINDTTIDLCCQVNDAYFNFKKDYLPNANILFSDKLLEIIEYPLDKYNIIFTCYNTSWICQPLPHPILYFPLARYPEATFNHKSHLHITVFHHSYNWVQYKNAREFKQHIESTSDLVFTGHEHLSSKSAKDNLEGNITEFIEGSILQDHDDEANSGFNLLSINLGEENHTILNFKWAKDIYTYGSKPPILIPLKRYNALNKRDFQINPEFLNILSDPGADFSHPRKKLELEDFFIYPQLRDFKIVRTKTSTLFNDISSESLLNINESSNRILLVGPRRSGKTSLCYFLFKHYYNSNYVPILLNGFDIKSHKLEKLDTLIFKSFTQQYLNGSYEKYSQLDISKKLLIIDDYDMVALNKLFKASLLKNINTIYPNIIITGDEFFPYDELTYQKEQKESLLESYQKYRILEFGNLLRHKLVNKWNSIGKEEYIDDGELIRKNDAVEQTLNTIIGRNLVPAYPFYLMIILQTIELGIPHNLKDSSFGYYYELLITKSLLNMDIRNEEIDAYNNYIVELANYFFEHKLQVISGEELESFHTAYCKEFSITLRLEVLISNLVKGFILESINSSYKFKHKYVHYYYVAKYIANNISCDEIKGRVSKICDRLYRRQLAEILMFLTHLSKDPFIINEIVTKARDIVKDVSPIKFEDDISVIDGLLEEIPKQMLKNREVKAVREERLKEKDEIELKERQEQEGIVEEYDLDEEIVSLDFISKLNLSIKTIEIMGQIMKNYYGSLKGIKKYEIGEEAYLIGLRSLNSIISLFASRIEILINEIASLISRDKVTDTVEKKKTAEKMVFSFFWLLSYGFIKRISTSIGSEKLSQTFKEILENNDNNAFRLIDISIKLDFFRSFPYSEVDKLAKTFTRKSLPYALLRSFVINYLYMFPTEFRDKQRICNILGISMQTQRVIAETSSQKKR